MNKKNIKANEDLHTCNSERTCIIMFAVVQPCVCHRRTQDLPVYINAFIYIYKFFMIL